MLMRAGLEEGSEMSAELVTHIDQCLGCMACVTACPSGVQYDKLIEDTRAQVERNTNRGPADRLFRRLLFEGFTHPGRLRALAPLLAGARRLGLDRRAANSGALSRFPRLRALAALTPRTPLRSSLRQIPRSFSPRGPARGRVGAATGMRAAGLLSRGEPGDRARPGRRGLRGQRAARAPLLRGAAASLRL